MRIGVADPADRDVAPLVAGYIAAMHALEVGGGLYTLDHARLSAPDITFLTARDGATVVGFAALRHLGDDRGEIKSMATTPGFERRGVARALLDHIVMIARQRQWRRLNLETGSGPGFVAARTLYTAFGFVDGPSYGDYGDDPLLTFFYMDL